MENTPRSKVRQETPPLKSLDGVPANLLCRSRNVKAFMGVDDATWDMWKESGLKTWQPGTKAEWVLTDFLLAFFAERPELTSKKIPPSKQRHPPGRTKK